MAFALDAIAPGVPTFSPSVVANSVLASVTVRFTVSAYTVVFDASRRLIVKFCDGVVARVGVALPSVMMVAAPVDELMLTPVTGELMMNEPVKLSEFNVPSVLTVMPRACAWNSMSGDISSIVKTVLAEPSAVSALIFTADVPVSFSLFFTDTVMFSLNITPSEFVYTTLNRKSLLSAALALSSKSSSVTPVARKISPVAGLMENLFTSIVEPVCPSAASRLKAPVVPVSAVTKAFNKSVATPVTSLPLTVWLMVWTEISSFSKISTLTADPLFAM